jgi:hypothetical protein
LGFAFPDAVLPYGGWFGLPQDGDLAQVSQINRMAVLWLYQLLGGGVLDCGICPNP